MRLCESRIHLRFWSSDVSFLFLKGFHFLLCFSELLLLLLEGVLPDKLLFLSLEGLKLFLSLSEFSFFVLIQSRGLNSVLFNDFSSLSFEGNQFFLSLCKLRSLVLSSLGFQGLKLLLCLRELCLLDVVRSHWALILNNLSLLGL